MSDSSGVGLRERKRAKTALAIHAAAIELVLERGLDAATVDAISERAGVSSRTFFNYFHSKEDAVLGIDENAIAHELQKARRYDGDPLASVFHLLYTLFEAGGGQHTDPALTREVMHSHPQLITRQMLRLAELEGRLSAMVAGWLATDPRFAGSSEPERLEEARLIIGICLATVRVSVQLRTDDHSMQPGGSAPADPRIAYEHSIATLRTVLEKLT